MAVPTTIPTGKKNALASLRKYLSEQLAPDVVLFEHYMNVEDIPSISFQDMGIPSLGGHAFDDYMGEQIHDDQTVTRVYGKIAQTMVEFNIITNEEDDTAAVRALYIMRDRLEYALMYSGRKKVGQYENGAMMADIDIMPRIALLDFDAEPQGVDTGATVWAPMEKDSVWIENFIGTDPERAAIKRLRILVRIHWHQLLPLQQ